MSADNESSGPIEPRSDVPELAEVGDPESDQDRLEMPTQVTTGIVQGVDRRRAQSLSKSQPCDALVARPRRNTQKVVNPNVSLDDSRCVELVKVFEHKGVVPERSERDAVVKYILREGTNAVVNKDYKRAEYFDDLNTRFLAAIAESNKDDGGERQQYFGDEIRATKQKLAAAQREWQGRLDFLKETAEKKEKELKNSHRSQLSEFDEYYEDVDHLREFSKASSYLLHLKCREKSMVLCNQYPDAKQIAKAAEKVEMEETLKAQSVAQQDIGMRKGNLMDRQTMEVDRIRNYYKKQAGKLQKEMDRELTLYKKRLAVLEWTKDEAVFEPVEVSGGSNPQPTGIRSPRTRKQYDNFRKSVPVRKLNLQPILGLSAKCPKPLRPRVGSVVSLLNRK